MPQVLWFLVGVAVTLAAMILFARRRTSAGSVVDSAADEAARMTQPPSNDEPTSTSSSQSADRDAPLPLTSAERTELELARRILDDTVRDLEALAGGIGRELAGLASAIEGHALHLLEAHEPRSRSARASQESLRSALRRLRTFSEKFLCFARVEPVSARRIDVRNLLEAIAEDVAALGARLRVETASAEFLPAVLGDERALRSAMLFLVETLIWLDRSASKVSLTARAEIQDEHETRVMIEIAVETESAEASFVATDDRAVHIGYVAARNLLEAMGGELAFDGVDGLQQNCYVSLPVHVRDEIPRSDRFESIVAPIELRDEPPRIPHHYGGVLILEGDPQLREMIAHELRARGRNIVSCVDSAAARSLIDATPDRFEVAILAADARGESLETVLDHACSKIPSLRVLVLGSTSGLTAHRVPAGIPIFALRKPFGVAELRAGLEEVLGAQPIDQRR